MTLNIPASTLGSGSNAVRGTWRTSRNSHHGCQPKLTSVFGCVCARFRAISYCSKASRRWSGDPTSSRNRARIRDPNVKGRFPKTRYGSCGSGTCKAFARTIATSGSLENDDRRRSAHTGSRSTAIRRPARSANGRVSRPEPAPISITRSRAEIRACSTSSVAKRGLRRKCCPSGWRPLGRGARCCATTDRHREGAHDARSLVGAGARRVRHHPVPLEPVRCERRDQLGCPAGGHELRHRAAEDR